MSRRWRLISKTNGTAVLFQSRLLSLRSAPRRRSIGTICRTTRASTWCIDGKTKSTDVSWFAEQSYPFVGVQKRAAQEFFEEKLSRRRMGRREQPVFRRRSSRRWRRRRRMFGRNVSRRARKTKANRNTASRARWACRVSKCSPGQTATVQFQLYLGPKLYHRLAQLTHDEAEIMDFGLWKLVSEVAA